MVPIDNNAETLADTIAEFDAFCETLDDNLVEFDELFARGEAESMLCVTDTGNLDARSGMLARKLPVPPRSNSKPIKPSVEPATVIVLNCDKKAAKKQKTLAATPKKKAKKQLTPLQKTRHNFISRAHHRVVKAAIKEGCDADQIRARGKLAYQMAMNEFKESFASQLVASVHVWACGE